MLTTAPRKFYRVVFVEEKKPDQWWPYLYDQWEYETGHTFDSYQDAEEFAFCYNAPNASYISVVEHERIAFLWNGREFDFSVDGPMHHDYACDANVQEVYWVDDTNEPVPDELVDVVYTELSDVVFERATTP